VALATKKVLAVNSFELVTFMIVIITECADITDIVYMVNGAIYLESGDVPGTGVEEMS